MDLVNKTCFKSILQARRAIDEPRTSVVERPASVRFSQSDRHTKHPKLQEIRDSGRRQVLKTLIAMAGGALFLGHGSLVRAQSGSGEHTIAAAEHNHMSPVEQEERDQLEPNDVLPKNWTSLNWKALLPAALQPRRGAMKKSKFLEGQITTALRLVDAGCAHPRGDACAGDQRGHVLRPAQTVRSRLTMETLDVLLISQRRISSVVVATAVLLCLGSGCASVPQTVRYTGGETLKQCPKDLGLDTGEQSVALVSIETDLLFDEFYLLLETTDLPFDKFYSLLEKDVGAKYLMRLSPRKLGMPTGDVIDRGRFKAKTFCYDIPSGNYHITKVIGVMRSRGPASMSEESVEYNHTREFTAPINRVIYLGRYILLDPRMKDKGYFERMGMMMSGMFTGSILPNDIEINIADSIDEDLAWMLEDHKQVQIEQVINAVR